MPEYARYIRAGGLDKPYLAPQEKDLIENSKWPSIFKNQIRLSKVRIDVLRPWINRRITELMGIEDEILVEYIITQLKDSLQNEKAKDLSEIKYLDPKILVLNLTGFMAKKAQPFVAELWEHMLSAQSTEHGVPLAFIQDKKHEIEILKEKSKLLENDLAKQREVKRESALEEIASRHKSKRVMEGRGSSPASPRRDRVRVRRDRSRSVSRSRSRSYDRNVRRRYRDRSVSRDRGGRYRRGSRSRSGDRDRRRRHYRSRSRSVSSDRYRRRRYRDRSASRSISSDSSSGRRRYYRSRSRSSSRSSDSIPPTPSPGSSRSGSSVEDNMSTSE